MNPIDSLGEVTEYLNPNISCYTKDMYEDLDDSATREICTETTKNIKTCWDANFEVCNETTITETNCWNETYNPFQDELETIVKGRVFSPEEYFKWVFADLMSSLFGYNALILSCDKDTKMVHGY